MTGGTAFFTNLIDNEDKTSEVIGGASSEAQDDDVHLAYRQTADMHMVHNTSYDYHVLCFLLI